MTALGLTCKSHTLHVVSSISIIYWCRPQWSTTPYFNRILGKKAPVIMSTFRTVIYMYYWLHVIIAWKLSTWHIMTFKFKIHPVNSIQYTAHHIKKDRYGSWTAELWAIHVHVLSHEPYMYMFRAMSHTCHVHVHVSLKNHPPVHNQGTTFGRPSTCPDIYGRYMVLCIISSL